MRLTEVRRLNPQSNSIGPPKHRTDQEVLQKIVVYQMIAIPPPNEIQITTVPVDLETVLAAVVAELQLYFSFHATGAALFLFLSAVVAKVGYPR